MKIKKINKDSAGNPYVISDIICVQTTFHVTFKAPAWAMIWSLPRYCENGERFSGPMSQIRKKMHNEDVDLGAPHDRCKVYKLPDLWQFFQLQSSMMRDE